MNRNHIILLIISSVIFSGCFSLKTAPKPDEIWTPPKWEKTTKAPDKIWKALREKEITSKEPLALVDLLDIALENSPATRQAWEEARASQTRIKQAESQWYPQVTASYEGAFERKVTNNKNYDLNQTTYTPTAQAQMLLLDFGGRASRVTEAKQALIAANFQYNKAFQDLVLNTEKAYYEYYSAEAGVESAKANVTDFKATLDAAQARLDAGVGVKLDVLQAKSDYEDALYSEESAVARLMRAKADLAKTVGFPADSDLQISVPKEEFSMKLAERDVSLIIEEGLRDRPDISAMRANVRSKDAARTAANSDLWPTLNIGGTAMSDEYEYYGAGKDNPLPPKRDYSYTGYMSVNWDIFDGFYLYSKRNEANMLFEAEKEKLKRAELDASADVWTKYYNYKTESKKYEFSKASLASSEEAYNLASEGYKAGLKTIIDLLAAQNQLSDSRSNLIQSRKDLFVSIVELGHSVGKVYLRQEEVPEGLLQ